MRRQEAEKEACKDGRPAFVTPAELSTWESDRDALIMCVSHCWETREHPDPCGHQLEQIANSTALYYAAHGVPVWVFYDYMSLFQYVRDIDQNRSYQMAMNDMHVLYTHETSYTLRVETLAPEALWQRCMDKPLSVYHEPSGCVTTVSLHDLLRHSPPYCERGWCQAELEFSSCRSQTARNQQIDAGIAQGGSEQTQYPKGKVPMTPAHFEEIMGNLVFTWRDADLEKVQQMQAGVSVSHERADNVLTRKVLWISILCLLGP